MRYRFLDQIELQPRERESLRALAARGSDTPFKLLALYQASPEAFAAHLGGEDRVKKIVAALQPMLSGAERALLSEPPAYFSTGALIDKE